MADAVRTILQIVPELETGGAELSAIEISQAVKIAGGRSLVLAEGGRLVPRLQAAGGEFVAFPAATKNPAKIIRNAGRIAEIARRENVQLIHARSRAPAWSALIAARRLKLPFVTTYHGAYKENSALKNWYNSVMARSDVVIANSRYTADLVKQRYGTPEAKMRVIYRGVDLERFDRAKVDPERCAKLRAAWGIGAGTPIVFNAARLTAWKGQSDLVALAARMHAINPEVVFILAGDDQGRSDYREKLTQQIRTLGLETVVRLVGHVDDVAAALATARAAFVASIEPEAFGRAAAEAQAMGCPVISTNIGAPPETVRAPPRVAAAERTGWLVRPGALDDYEAALREALALSPADRERFAARASRNIRENFSTANMQRQTLEVYDRLTGWDLAARFRAAGA